MVSPYPQTQEATQFVDCFVCIRGEAKQGGIRKWLWVGTGPKECLLPAWRAHSPPYTEVHIRLKTRVLHCACIIQYLSYICHNPEII